MRTAYLIAALALILSGLYEILQEIPELFFMREAALIPRGFGAMAAFSLIILGQLNLINLRHGNMDKPLYRSTIGLNAAMAFTAVPMLVDRGDLAGLMISLFLVVATVLSVARRSLEPPSLTRRTGDRGPAPSPTP